MNAGTQALARGASARMGAWAATSRRETGEDHMPRHARDMSAGSARRTASGRDGRPSHVRDAGGKDRPYDPFADPFNDEEEFERFQEAEAERTRRIVLVVALLFVVGMVVLLFFLGDLLARVAGA